MAIVSCAEAQRSHQESDDAISKRLVDARFEAYIPNGITNISNKLITSG